MTHIWTDEEKAKREEMEAELAIYEAARKEADRELRRYVRRVAHTDFCMAEIEPTDWWSIPFLCSRKAGYGKDGQYCRQHAKKYPQ